MSELGWCSPAVIGGNRELMGSRGCLGAGPENYSAEGPEEHREGCCRHCPSKDARGDAAVSAGETDTGSGCRRAVSGHDRNFRVKCVPQDGGGSHRGWRSQANQIDLGWQRGDAAGVAPRGRAATFFGRYSGGEVFALSVLFGEVHARGPRRRQLRRARIASGRTCQDRRLVLATRARKPPLIWIRAGTSNPRRSSRAWRVFSMLVWTSLGEAPRRAVALIFNTVSPWTS